MADCFLCENFVGEGAGDGGLKGRLIGTRDICESCLAELKFCMADIEAKRPVVRTTNKSSEDNDKENIEESNLEEETSEDESSNEENYNPASAGVKI